MDDELDEKIKLFRGKKDEEKKEDDDPGKLMVDEEKEEIHVDMTTYQKIVSMCGGTFFVVLLVASQILNEAFDGWSNVIRNKWATES